MNAPLAADELNARYDPMNRDELIAECERLREALRDIYDWYMDDANSASGDTGGHALDVSSTALGLSTVTRG